MEKHKTVSLFFTTLTLLLLLLAAGCSTPAPSAYRASSYIITGSINANDIVLFPELAQIEIQLNEEPQNQETDEQPTTIAKQIIKNPQVNPVSFALRYDPEDVLDYRIYSVTVKIFDSDGLLLYQSPASTQVITSNNPKKVSLSLDPAT